MQFSAIIMLQGQELVVVQYFGMLHTVISHTHHLQTTKLEIMVEHYIQTLIKQNWIMLISHVIKQQIMVVRYGLNQIQP